MKVLWIVNIVFPEALNLLSGIKTKVGSGAWLLASAEELIKDERIDLYVACCTTCVKDITCLKGERITYYLYPDNSDYKSSFKHIHDCILPDVIHIHGTETPYGFAYLQACGNTNVVVSIQGVISEIWKYYNYGLSNMDILKNITFRDLFGRTLWHDEFKCKARGKNEIRLLKSVEHVIGRTSFDHSHVWAINPKITYHFCSEALRKEFYTGHWRFNNCEPHTIFISQAWYPLKGFHILLKAMPLILRQYSDTRIKIAGTDILKTNGFLGSLRQQGYYKYISRLIKELNLFNHLQFTGLLSAEDMKQALLKSNVFVCPSSIENSSNSLSEAQILGVPCVVSYAGGLPDLAKDCNNTLQYRFEDVEMLAYNICKVFDERERFEAEDLSPIRHRHNVENIIANTIEIYSSISNA